LYANLKKNAVILIKGYGALHSIPSNAFTLQDQNLVEGNIDFLLFLIHLVVQITTHKKVFDLQKFKADKDTIGSLKIVKNGTTQFTQTVKEFKEQKDNTAKSYLVTLDFYNTGMNQSSKWMKVKDLVF
jgi:hypothetical protein